MCYQTQLISLTPTQTTEQEVIDVLFVCLFLSSSVSYKSNKPAYFNILKPSGASSPISLYIPIFGLLSTVGPSSYIQTLPAPCHPV